jgi:hypothetical protein
VLLTRLTDSDIPTTQPHAPALTPGEQRRIDLPLPQGTSSVTCEITYERNHYEPGTYELPLYTLKEQAAPPITASR